MVSPFWNSLETATTGTPLWRPRHRRTGAAQDRKRQEP